MVDLKTAEEIHYLAQCCKLAYPPYHDVPGHLGLEDLKWLHDEQKGSRRGFVARSQRGMLIVLKGTQTIEDFLVDANFKKALFLGKYWVHAGFLHEFDELWPAVRLFLSSYRQDSPATVFVTGHSLGASIAELLAMAIKTDLEIDAVVRPIAPPKAGNGAFARAYNRLVPDTIRVIHNMDLVPRIPKFFYSQVGKLLHLTDTGRIIPAPESLVKWAWGCIRVLVSDATGQSLRNHRAETYVQCTEALVQNLQQVETKKIA